MGVEVCVSVCYIIAGGCGECRAVGCLWVYGWGGHESIWKILWPLIIRVRIA